jgi:hypothetical protein
MYLHELGDTEASFTKEEMHQGKHQEYEKRLHDSLIAQMQSQQTPTNPTSSSPQTTLPEGAQPATTTVKTTNGETKEKDPATNEAWPSLSTSPITIKEGKANGKAGKESAKSEANRKHEKVKGHEKKGKAAQKQMARDKVKAQMLAAKAAANKDLDDELGETDDTDDTPSISSTTDSGTISESDSGKSSPPSSFPDPVHPGHHMQQQANIISVTATTAPTTTENENEQNGKSIMSPSSSIIETGDITALYGNGEKGKDGGSLADTSGEHSKDPLVCGIESDGSFLPARLSKLSLFDDNSSFFSRGFNSFPKIDGSSEHSQAMNNAQLPDLLNGTVNNNTMNLDIDPKLLLKNLGSFGSLNSHGENTHDDWESAFKYLMNNKKHYEDHQQQEEWLRFQEMRKHSSGLGLNQFNMFGSEFESEIGRLSADIQFDFQMRTATSTICLRKTKSIA